MTCQPQVHAKLQLLSSPNPKQSISIIVFSGEGGGAKDGGRKSRVGRQRQGILVNLRLDEGRGEAAVIGSS